MIRIHVLFVALIVGASAASASPVTSAPLDRLCAVADLIIVADVVDGTVLNGVANITVRVARNYKGDRQPGDIVNLSWGPLPVMAGKQSPIHTDRGVFFLKTDLQGGVVILPAMTGQALQFERTYFRIPAAEREGGLPPSPALTPLAHVLDDLAWATENGVPQDRGALYDFPNLMWIHKDAASPATLNRLEQAKLRAIRSLARAHRITNGDVTALEGLDERARSKTGEEADDLRRELNALKYYYQNGDPVGVERLGRYASDATAPLELRTAAASALARLHTIGTLPYLARMLDETDPMLLAAAVGGLSMFANNVPIGSHQPSPSSSPYRTEETIARAAMDPAIILARRTYYVDYWRKWWNETKDRIPTLEPSK